MPSFFLPHLVERRIRKRYAYKSGIRPITVYNGFSDQNLIGGTEVKGLEEHLQLIGELDGSDWRQRLAEIRAKDPVAAFGGFAGLEGSNTVTPAALSAVTFVSGDFSPYNGVTFCPVPNRSTHMDFWASFTFALAATPGTLLVTPGVGTALTAKNLGAGVATATLGTSGTAVMLIEGELTTRTITIPGGSAGAWYFTGTMVGKLATSGNGTADVNQLIGFTAATGDSTASNGLWMTMTGTATSVTVSTQQIKFGSWS